MKAAVKVERDFPSPVSNDSLLHHITNSPPALELSFWKDPEAAAVGGGGQQSPITPSNPIKCCKRSRCAQPMSIWLLQDFEAVGFGSPQKHLTSPTK